MDFCAGKDRKFFFYSFFFLFTLKFTVINAFLPQFSTDYYSTKLKTPVPTLISRAQISKIAVSWMAESSSADPLSSSNPRPLSDAVANFNGEESESISMPAFGKSGAVEPKIQMPEKIPPPAKPVAVQAQAELDSFQKLGLPWWLNPNTRGGSIVVATLSLVFPISIYYWLQAAGMEDVVAGQYVGVGFVLISCVLWTFTYIFRVATKDMTYAKQLKDYENAVLAKRLEELKEDEVEALIEEIDRENSL